MLSTRYLSLEEGTSFFFKTGSLSFLGTLWRRNYVALITSFLFLLSPVLLRDRVTSVSHISWLFTPCPPLPAVLLAKTEETIKALHGIQAWSISPEMVLLWYGKATMDMLEGPWLARLWRRSPAIRTQLDVLVLKQSLASSQGPSLKKQAPLLHEYFWTYLGKQDVER